ncbi:sperm acrosome membrane-associated protein 4-like [Sinocyclocheilus rhinocerous]|uniref:sperm acrosome membrane-associated protein 4-like n=1 Tax=Sinocyclocheilus rhinocerous TaxID=307959 RepID=UPI0007B7F799|nr:PREDICTED: sperm acrosome membrane-associated protein 4-like [Sinocyclocheilus rhinocerous]
MNKIFLGIFAVDLSTLYLSGQALQCYECKLGFWYLCITSKKTCDAGEHCFSGIGKAGGLVDIKMKGCLEVSNCNKTVEANFPSNSSTKVYQMKKMCCSTDLCNSAPGHFHMSAVSMAFATINSVFTVKFLI